MLKRHVDQLWARLDELYANGTTFMSWGELYHWYNIERIAKAPWRDIQERWEELLEDKKEEYLDPQVAEVPGGVSLFYSRKPGKLSKLAE
jgi:predicted P-loop ATPase